jgi:hypothetical protein
MNTYTYKMSGVCHWIEEVIGRRERERTVKKSSTQGLRIRMEFATKIQILSISSFET